jgi:hypothetical protein
MVQVVLVVFKLQFRFQFQFGKVVFQYVLSIDNQNLPMDWGKSGSPPTYVYMILSYES